jgi:hypothetical protein
VVSNPRFRLTVNSRAASGVLSRGRTRDRSKVSLNLNLNLNLSLSLSLILSLGARSANHASDKHSRSVSRALMTGPRADQFDPSLSVPIGRLLRTHNLGSEPLNLQTVRTRLRVTCPLSSDGRRVL